jgi:hypothetical protein
VVGKILATVSVTAILQLHQLRQAQARVWGPAVSSDWICVLCVSCFHHSVSRGERERLLSTSGGPVGAAPTTMMPTAKPAGQANGLKTPEPNYQTARGGSSSTNSNAADRV